MNLPTYIKTMGDAKAAKRFGVKIRTVASWRRRERIPRPRQAEKIVRSSRGAVTYEDIFSVKKKQNGNASRTDQVRVT